jgi:antitoxin component YwqK of YwqJK toxin-antitoxin module
MRFTSSGFDFFRILRFNSQRLTRIVTMPLTNAYLKLRRYLNPNGFSTKVMGDIRKEFRESISAKPSSLKDYFALPRYYVAKWVVFVVILAVILLPVLYIKYAHPVIEAKFFTKTMVINTSEMSGYTGKVKLLSPTTGRVIYQGPLVNGRVTGQGILYDPQGKLVYQGGFLSEMYDGEGQAFYPNGQTQYKGSFVKNNYEGTGFLYRENGSLQYEGGFLKGLYEGVGKEYYDNGSLRYEGDFAKNEYQGSGVLYDRSGQIIYNGEFKNGKYEGQGTLYENGAMLYQGQLAAGMLNGEGKIYSGEMVLYEGSFKDNHYNGAGKAYDPVTGKLIYDGNYESGKYSGAGKLFDPQTGNLIYQGDFYDGTYEGNGKLFDSTSGFPLYEGGFRAGRFDGKGVEYDPLNGSLLYDGGFLLDNYNGDGTLYDPTTGKVVSQGVFQSGGLLLDNGKTAEPGGGTSGGGSSGENGSGENGSGESSSGTTPGESGGAIIYKGPTTANGIDYQALTALDAQTAQDAFSKKGTAWSLATGTSLVYEDATEGLGLTLQVDQKGQMIGVDVWNDAVVQGAKAGMTRAQLDAALGGKGEEVQGTMGEARMVSVSQSNRFHNRMTNLSQDSQVTIVRYKTGNGVLQAVFAKGIEECLVIEVRKA